MEVIDLLQDVNVPISYRQLDYWVRLGLLSPRTEDGQEVRGGFARAFTPADLETLYVVALLYAMGADRGHVMAAADVLRPRRVSVAHPEVLLMSLDLTVVARITMHQLRQSDRIDRPCWVIP